MSVAGDKSNSRAPAERHVNGTFIFRSMTGFLRSVTW